MARADNTAFGNLLTTINNLGREVSALQALTPLPPPIVPAQPPGNVLPVDAATLAGCNLGSFNNTVHHNEANILALRSALGAMDVTICVSDVINCTVPLPAYLGLDVNTVVATAGTDLPSLVLTFQPGDPCVPQLTAATRKG